MLDHPVLSADGTRIARVGGSGHTGEPYVRGRSARFDRMNESGFWDDVAAGVHHPSCRRCASPPRTATASSAR